MADTPEKKVKKQLTAQLKALGAYYFYPATGGYGKSGVPDVICCYKGRFFGFECKAGKNKPTALQELNLNEIRAAGGFAIIVDEENVGIMRDYVVGATNDDSE
jgi:Holliday junction resolvase